MMMVNKQSTDMIFRFWIRDGQKDVAVDVFEIPDDLTNAQMVEALYRWCARVDPDYLDRPGLEYGWEIIGHVTSRNQVEMMPIPWRKTQVIRLHVV